jgi:hypothetical protein
MRKGFIFGLGAALAVLVTLTSCMSEKSIGKYSYIWDDSLPAEQTALVQFVELKLKSYNGISVDTKKKAFFQLPAGDAVFVVDVNARGAYVIYTAKDAPFRIRLEAGKKYCLWFGTSGKAWGVNVYDELFLRAGGMDTKDFVGFIPFIQAPRENRILE